MKVCIRCGAEKPLEGFHKRAGSSDGHHNTCKDCKHAHNKRWHDEHQDQMKAKRRALYLAKREETIQARREFRARDKERINARRRARRAANPDRERALSRARYKRNPEPHLTHCRKRKFRRRNVRIEEIVERDGWKCGICSGPIAEDFEIDHIMPRSLGGSNEIENLQLAHRLCNRRKVANPDFRLTPLETEETASA